MSDKLLTYLIVSGCVLALIGNKDRVIEMFAYNSSPLDWCERNHEYSTRVVEFWNSLSSLLLCLVAIVGHVVYLRDDKMKRYEPKLFAIWILMWVVGAGSVWFHGTLSIAGQISDEVPIVLLAVFAIMLSRPKSWWPKGYREFFLSLHTWIRFCSMLTVVCLLYPKMSHVFTLACFPGCGYFFFSEYARSKSQHVIRLFRAGIVSFTLAFGCWITDRVACDQVADMSFKYLGMHIQLHAIWHACMAVTFWLLIAIGMLMRGEVDKVHMAVKNLHGILPVAVIV